MLLRVISWIGLLLLFLFITNRWPARNLLITIRHGSLAPLGCPAYHHTMRIGALIFAFVLTLGCYLFFRAQLNARTADLPPAQTCELKSSAAPASAKIVFATQIKPIFEAKCQPCHFNGGTMYERLPFDRPETIKTLGTKLFTRIKDENQRTLIREFLAQQ